MITLFLLRQWNKKLCNIELLKSFFLEYQRRLCQALTQSHEEKNFSEDRWAYPEGGGGVSCVFEQGKTLERAGVNFSHIQGKALPSVASEKRQDLAKNPFVAMGVSAVIHPHNPYVPTAHLNLRFFQSVGQDKTIWWFGGGFDLTPYYPFEEDCIHWHSMAQKACLPFGKDVYSKFKKNCDAYFYLKHRKETRGIGGIFFDDLNEWSFEDCFSFIQSVGEHFILGYLPILEKRKNAAFSERERDFQLYRRGRYIEFNLVYDRGTLFGLQSNGRTESILMSLPPSVSYKYNWQPEPDSPESKLYSYLSEPKEWV